MSSKGYSLLPTSGIADPQVRAFLDRLVEAWDARNYGDDAFVDRKRFGALAANAVAGVLGGEGNTVGQDGLVGTAIDNLAESIRRGILYQILEQTIRPIDLEQLRRRVDETVSLARAGIHQETQVRINKDMALASAINNIWAQIGGSAAVIEDGSLAAATPTSASADRWTQVVAAVTDPNTGTVSSAAILQETRAFADNTNNTFNAIYTVRAQIATGGTTYTGTAAAPTATVNNKGNTVLTLSTAPTGTPTVGMKVYGSGIQGGTTVSAYTYPNVTLSLALNRAASTEANGYFFSTQELIVGGFGLSASTGAGSSSPPSIDFGVLANRFWIGAPSGSYDPASEYTANNQFPFIVVTTPTTINGVSYPAGVYMKKAVIGEASIDTAKIFQHIKSGNFNGTFDASNNIATFGTAGWAIDKSGQAVFNNVKVRGDIEANSVTAGSVNTPGLASNAATSTSVVSGSGVATPLALSVATVAGDSSLIIIVDSGASWSGTGGESDPVTSYVDYSELTVNSVLTVKGRGTYNHVIQSPGTGTVSLSLQRIQIGNNNSRNCSMVALRAKR